MIKGLSLEQAWESITWKKVTEEIGGLPSVKFHCGVLAVGALKRAIRQYFKEKGIGAPGWLPADHTFEEKQALEEEELAKLLSKRLKVGEEKKAET
jgi:nitrogen fixation NifU-like protein